MPNVNPICTNVNKSSTPAVLQNLRTHHNYLLLKVLDLLDTVIYFQINKIYINYFLGVFCSS